jgi:hypothetical protein
MQDGGDEATLTQCGGGKSPCMSAVPTIRSCLGTNLSQEEPTSRRTRLPKRMGRRDKGIARYELSLSRFA